MSDGNPTVAEHGLKFEFQVACYTSEGKVIDYRSGFELSHAMLPHQLPLSMLTVSEMLRRLLSEPVMKEWQVFSTELLRRQQACDGKTTTPYPNSFAAAATRLAAMPTNTSEQHVTNHPTDAPSDWLRAA